MKILYIVDSVVPATEISVRPLNWLATHGMIAWKSVRIFGVTPAMIHQADLVIFHRNCHPAAQMIFRSIHEYHKPTIYEVDDSYADLQEHPSLGGFYNSPATRETFNFILQNVTVIKAGSYTLKERLSYQEKTIVLDYAVDTDIFENGLRLSRPGIWIGFAGSPSHSDDLGFIASTINKLIQTSNSELHFEFIGCKPPTLTSSKTVNIIPFISGYDNYLRELYRHNWDIGLAPLIDTPWNICKTDNKFREYGACGICGVYSDIPPFSLVVENRRTGMLVQNSQDAWYETLSQLINNSGLREDIKKTAKEYTLGRYGLEKTALQYYEVFRQLTNLSFTVDG